MLGAQGLEEQARQLGILIWLFAKSLTHTAPLWGKDSTYFVELLWALDKYSVEHRAWHIVKLKSIHVFF